MSLLLFFGAAAAGSSTGTGALQAQSSVVAGTAEREITDNPGSTVELESQSSIVAGTAQRGVVDTGTVDNLQAQDAVVAGTGTVSGETTGTGALAAQDAVVAGTGVRHAVAADDNLQAQDAAVAGTAEREVVSVYPASYVLVPGVGLVQLGTNEQLLPGAVLNQTVDILVSQSATVAGTGTVSEAGESTGTGTLQAQDATVAGTAEREIVDTGTVDNLQAQDATVAGTGARVVTAADDNLQAQAAIVAGTGTGGTAGEEIYSVGSDVELEAQSATMAGTAERTVVDTGTLDNLQAQSAVVEGTGELVFNGGFLQAQSAVVAGTGVRGVNGTGDLIAQNSPPAGQIVSGLATIAGTGARGTTGTGVLQAQPAVVADPNKFATGSDIELEAQSATMSGTAFAGNSGQLLAQSATVSGTGTWTGTGSSFGHIASQAAVMAGTGSRVITGTGALEAQLGAEDRGVLTAGEASVSGDGDRASAGTGALAAQSATVVGSGRSTGGTGTVQAQSATMAGTGVRGVVSTPYVTALQAQSASISASVSVNDTITSLSGDLQAQSALAVGAGSFSNSRGGGMVSQPATVAGTGSRGHFSLICALNAQVATVAGTGEREITAANDDLAAQAAVVAGAGDLDHSGTGALAAQSAATAGEGQVGLIVGGTGALVCFPATIEAAAATWVNHTGTGDLAAQAAAVAGAGHQDWTGSGALAAQDATVVATTAIGLLVNRYVLMSTETGGSEQPFHLVFTPDGLHIQIWVDFYGELLPSTTEIDPYETNQLGFKYWFDGTTHSWQYLINGVLDNIVTYTGPALRANVNSIARTLSSERNSLPGWYDEMLYWRAGNTLTDTDLYRAWQSYYSTPGFTSSVCGTLEMVKEAIDVYLVGFTSSTFGSLYASGSSLPVTVLTSPVIPSVFYSMSTVYTFESTSYTVELTGYNPATVFISSGPESVDIYENT